MMQMKPRLEKTDEPRNGSPVSRIPGPEFENPNDRQSPEKILSAFAALIAHLPAIFTGDNVRSLMRLRASLPFIPIIPFARDVRTARSDGTVSIDLAIPDGSKLVRFSSNGNFLVNMTGMAAWPGTANVNQDQTDYGVLNPTNGWYYVENVKSLSVIGEPGITTFIGAEFFIQL